MEALRQTTGWCVHRSTLVWAEVGTTRGLLEIYKIFKSTVQGFIVLNRKKEETLSELILFMPNYKSSLLLCLPIAGSLSAPAVAGDLRAFQDDYAMLQTAMCLRQQNQALAQFQRLMTPETVRAYRHNTPMIIMTPGCPHVGMAVSVRGTGQVVPEPQVFRTAYPEVSRPETSSPSFRHSVWRD